MAKYETVVWLCRYELSQVTPPSIDLAGEPVWKFDLSKIAGSDAHWKDRWVLYSFSLNVSEQKDGSTKGEVNAFGASGSALIRKVQQKIGL